MKKSLAFLLIIYMLIPIFASCDTPTVSPDVPDTQVIEKSTITLIVSSDGNDNTADGTAEKPFATIETATKAVFLAEADKYSHVDILIKEGEYTIPSPITIEKTENFETIRFIGEGEVKINGQASNGLFQISSNSVTLENLKLDSSAGYGIEVVADNISVIDCEISGISGNAIKIRGNNITIRGSHIHDCAESAITVDAGDLEKLEKSGSVIYNNLIHDCGNGEANTPLINARGVDITVSHNEMWGSPSSAIYWNGAYITVEYNEIYDILTGNEDRGALFTTGIIQTGNIIRYNYIHNIGGNEKVTLEGGNDHCAAIQGKSFASYYEVYGNIIETVNGNGMQIGGRNITVRGNLIIDCANWYVWGMAHQYSQYFRYGETDGILAVPDYIYSPLWKEANPDLANLITDLSQTTFTDPRAWATPVGITIQNNHVHFNRFGRYFNNWGTAPYSVEDAVFYFSEETLELDSPGDHGSKNITEYNSKRNEVVIEDLLTETTGLVDMDVERFNKIGRVMEKWNLD